MRYQSLSGVFEASIFPTLTPPPPSSGEGVGEGAGALVGEGVTGQLVPNVALSEEVNVPPDPTVAPLNVIVQEPIPYSQQIPSLNESKIVKV